MNPWANFRKEDDRTFDADLPKVSIIIPTENSAPMIASTLETLLKQDYPYFEIIVIDATSRDRTLEVINSFRDDRVKTYSVSEYARYAMLNKGITHASGHYLNFLFPGDFYLNNQTLRLMMELAREHNEPAMVYCGTVLRAKEEEIKVMYRKLSLSLLRSGRQPTSLQSCWFKQDIFHRIGMFDTTLQQRGGFDLMCRIVLDGFLKFGSTQRILTDYDLRFVTRKMVVRHFFETMKIINHYFGIFALSKWFIKQKDLSRYLKLWSRSLKVAFTGKTP